MTLPRPLSRAALAAALALSVAACAHGGPPRPTPRALEERGILIAGARAVAPEDVAALIRCEGAGTPEAACSFDALWGLYDRRGHPRARFTLRRVGARAGRALHELAIDEGPRFRVQEVRVDGLDGLPEARAWIEALPLRPGAPFSAYVHLMARDELLSAARGAGHGEAEVVGSADPDLRASAPGAYAVVARYAVDLGPRGEPWTLGRVAVEDADARRRRRIERELATLLRPGDPFDYARFAAARARLGAYRTAEVLVGKPDEARREIPVLVRVGP